MLTKDELLAKGVSEEVADQVIAALQDGNADDDSLQALQKALEDPEMDSLFKAEKGGDDNKGGDEDEDKDYNEEYMKRKRYMKENKSACAKTAKEVGIFSDKMEKAIDDINVDADGVMMDMADLKPFLEAQKEFNGKLVKAIEDISSAVLVISAQNEKSFNVMKKAAGVTLTQAELLGEFMGKPAGRKGVVSVKDEMRKASDIAVISVEGSKAIYSVLMKATQNHDSTAGQILSALESLGKDAHRLNKVQRKYIDELIKKEAK